MARLYEKKISFEKEFLNEFNEITKSLDSPKYIRINIQVNANAITKNYIAIISADLDTLKDYTNDLYEKFECSPNRQMISI
jgi:hypothetical protein